MFDSTLYNEKQVADTMSSSSNNPASARPKRHIFSAYEVGRIVNSELDLARITEGGMGIVFESTPVRDIHDLYHQYEDLDYIPVVNQDGVPTGYLTRNSFMAHLGQSQYAMDLYLRKDVTVDVIMDQRVVSLDAYTMLPDASMELMKREDSIRFDPFVVTLEGAYYGISTVRHVLDGLNFYMRLDMDACNDAQLSLTGAANRDLLNRNDKLEYAYYISQLKKPGGDYAAAYELDENRVLIFLFDVCGKGLKASNMVLAIGTAFQSWVELDIRRRGSLAQFNAISEMDKINKLICTVTPGDMYATGVVIFYDRSNHKIELFDYGHGFVWLKQNGRVVNLAPEERDRERESRGIHFFGVNRDYTPIPMNYQLKEGDLLFACSDGIIEGFNCEHEEFGDTRVVRVFEEFEGDDPGELINMTVGRWKDFRHGYRTTDDVSLIALKV